jgi:hypothetical protein
MEMEANKKTDKDNLVLGQSTADQTSPSEPFLEKKLVYMLDNNGSSNYQLNEIEFETDTWSSAGSFLNHREGFVLIPFVFHVESNKNLSTIDLNIKSDNLHFINSCRIDYNNSSVVQGNPEISPYLDFLKKTSCSFGDIQLFSHTGFRANDPNWEFDPHYGICSQSLDQLPSYFYSNNDYKKELYGDTYGAASGINFVDKTDPKNHYYYYNCYIRLKDFPFMNSMSLTRGAKLKILFTLNQMKMSFINNSGTINQQTNKKGSYCPFLLDKDVLDNLLTADTDYLNVNCSVAMIDDNHRHAIHQPRLYSPAYTLTPTVKKSLELNPQRKLVFTDVYINHIRRIPTKNTFNYLVNNSITRVKRLIIFPVISSNTSDDNGNGKMVMSSLDSPFCEATPAPCNIENFNVSISGMNVYSTTKKFKFENYLDELDCSYGVEGGLENGVSTGVFGLHEYENNHNYFVVDLSRKLPFDEKEAVSVEISGDNKGKRHLDLICYLEYEKDITLDIFSGLKL